MASTTLYPAIVDSYMPAFIASGSCTLYYSLSKYSSTTEEIKSIHISVARQKDGQSVVIKNDNPEKGIYRSSGIIIINAAPTPVQGKDNLYAVTISNEDVHAGDTLGWQIGWIYKLQIRLSTREYDPSILTQERFLQIEANSFSEWSTCCTTKAIGYPQITIPVMKNFNSYTSGKGHSDNNIYKQYTIGSNTLEITGSYANVKDNDGSGKLVTADSSEILYSYQCSLYDTEENLLEDSGIIYTNNYYAPNQFHYLFKYELENETSYIFKFSYSTINKYEESFTFNLLASYAIDEEDKYGVYTLESIDELKDIDFDFVKNFKKATTKSLEEEDGRIALRLYCKEEDPQSINLCIRRADSRDNFKTWTDIKIIPFIDEEVNSYPIIYDYTVESGIWYKYSVQIIEVTGLRMASNINDTPVLREFEYGFLVGEGGRQLKVKYNNTMGSYAYNILESKTDTIGGKYAFISRNGNVYYRTFPLNGLISFNMDDIELFTNDKELYKYNNIVTLYQNRRKDEHLEWQDYRREFDFREKVLEFLQDGKPKLFKSATEGNIIVRLMQVAVQPNQTVNRLIASFTATANEVADATMENYLKYNFYEVGDYVTSFEKYDTKLGQIEFDCPKGGDIIKEIWRQYDRSSYNIDGMRYSLKSIHDVSIEFDGKPLRLNNNLLGHQLIYNNGQVIYINTNFNNVYSFDPLISFTKDNSLKLVGDAEGTDISVHLLVNFLYEEGKKVYQDKFIDSYSIDKNIGQFYANCKPGENIFREMYYKFYYEWGLAFKRLNRIQWTCIEADPGSVFLLKDAQDENSEQHEIGFTGVLNLEDLGDIIDLRYIGKRLPDGSIDTTASTDVLIDYLYHTTEGTYSEEN